MAEYGKGSVTLLNSEFYRQTWVEVQLDAITNNIKSTQRLLPEQTKIMAVVKANGYGHGAVEVAKAAIKAGVEYLAVALLDEAIVLRKKGITVPILVLGYCPPEYAHIAATNNISLTVFQKEWLIHALDNIPEKQIKVHVKIDLEWVALVYGKERN